LKAILYAAKSTEDIRGSITTQLQDARNMADRQGWDIAGEYAEQAVSAWKSDRGPQLKAAMRHAEDMSPCVLLVQHSDRLARGDGRSARHLGELYFWAIKAGVELRSVQDDATFTNPLLTFAMGERNAEDSRRKSLAVAAGMRRRSEAGKHHGGPRPYGYEYQDGGLVMVSAEAEIVRRIYTEYLAGRSLTAIARDLHRESVSTARGRRWRQSSVSGVLANPIYTGHLRSNGEVLDGLHEPIVETDDWERAQGMLTSRKNKGRGRPPRGDHLFRGGLLRCECGEAMVPRTNGSYQMYYCNGRSKLGRDYCDMPHVRRVEIDSAVYRYFEQVGLDIEATRQTLAEARDRKLAEVSALRLQAEAETRKAEERLSRVRRDYTDGHLDVSDWQQFRLELTGELDAAAAEAERLSAQEREVLQWAELRDAEADTWRLLSDVRAAIAGEVRDTEGINAVRAALSRTFESFVLRRTAPRVHVELIAEPKLLIEPIVRERAVRGYTEHLRPVLEREPLNQQPPASAETMFGLIKVRP
jgi:site-specific DNA recombinase